MSTVLYENKELQRGQRHEMVEGKGCDDSLDCDGRTVGRETW